MATNNAYNEHRVTDAPLSSMVVSGGLPVPVVKLSVDWVDAAVLVDVETVDVVESTDVVVGELVLEDAAFRNINIIITIIYS